MNQIDLEKLLSKQGRNLSAVELAEQLDTVETYMELKNAVQKDWPLIFEILFGHTIKKCHREWVNFQLKNPWTILLGPRLFGKTQVCVKDYILLSSLKSRNERILILGKTLPQARGILREIRFQLEKNELVNIFGNFFDKGEDRTEKSQTEVFFSGRTEIFSEPNISALGIGGSVITRHFTKIFGDDLVDSSNSSGKNASLLYQWLKEEVMPMMLPNGELHLIGSSWAERDLYHRLIKENQEGKSDFKYLVFSAYDDDENSIWPEWISNKDLEKWELRMGTPFFKAQFRNDISMLDRERKLFFEVDVQIRNRAEVLRRAERLIIGIDPSTGEGNNWTGVSVVAKVKEDISWPRFWIIDQFKEKFGSTETKKLVKALIKKYPSTEILIVEAIGFQKDLANELSAELPVEMRFPVGSKQSRINRVGNIFQQGAVGCCEECLELMKDFWDYPDGDSVDLIDAFDDAWSFLFDEEREGEYEDLDLRTEEERRRDKYKEKFAEKFGVFA